MTTMVRHGASSHYLRPDAVYRTSVIQPMGGFVPQRDVMAVARSFTQGPYMFMQGASSVTPGQGVAGLFGPRAQVHLMGLAAANMGFFQKLKMRYQAWKARRAMGMQGLRGFYPYGPKAWAGPMAVSLPANRMAMLVAMQEKDQPMQIAENNTNVLMQRWNALRLPSSY